MKDLEIFDKDGNALHIANVISRFITIKENKYNCDVLLSKENDKILVEKLVMIDRLDLDNYHEWFKTLESIDLNDL